MHPVCPVPPHVLPSLQAVFEAPEVPSSQHPLILELLGATALKQTLLDRIAPTVDPFKLPKLAGLFNPTRLLKGEQVVFRAGLSKDFLILCVSGRLRLYVPQSLPEEEPELPGASQQRFSRFPGQVYSRFVSPPFPRESRTFDSLRSGRFTPSPLHAANTLPKVSAAQKKVSFILESLQSEANVQRFRFDSILSTHKRKANLKVETTQRLQRSFRPSSAVRNSVAPVSTPQAPSRAPRNSHSWDLGPGGVFGDLLERGKLAKETLVLTATADSFYLTASAGDLQEFMLENRIEKVKRRKANFIQALGLPPSFQDSKELDALLSKIEVD